MIQTGTKFIVVVALACLLLVGGTRQSMAGTTDLYDALVSDMRNNCRVYAKGRVAIQFKGSAVGPHALEDVIAIEEETCLGATFKVIRQLDDYYQTGALARSDIRSCVNVPGIETVDPRSGLPILPLFMCLMSKLRKVQPSIH